VSRSLLIMDPGTAWCGHLPVKQEISRIQFPMGSPNYRESYSLTNITNCSYVMELSVRLIIF